MSLSRLALRIITVKALQGATLAGEAVFDSAVDPIDVQVRQNRRPFVVVTTDEHKRTITGRDLRQGNDLCDVVIEVAVASKVEAETGADEQIIIPQTDANMEVVLDLIGHQTTEALMGGKTEWSELWKLFAMGVVSITSRRGASAEQGVRFAARQMVVTTDLIGDPVRGGDMSAAWTRLLTAMEADAELGGTAALIRYAIEGDAPLTEEAFVASLFAIPPETVAALGLTPVRDEAGNPVTLDEVVVQQEDGLPDLTLTEDGA